MLKFGSGIIVVRVISKGDYGIWSYAHNVLSLFLLFKGFGAVSGILQFCSEQKDATKRDAFFKFGIKISSIANSSLVLLAAAVLLFFNLPITGSRTVLYWLLFYPVIDIANESIKSYLRARLKNKEYSNINNISNVLNFITIILFGYFWGIRGLIISRYFASILTFLFAFRYILHNIKTTNIKDVLSLSEKKDFLYFSSIAISSNAISQILYILDIFLVGIFFKDADIVATYKVATIIPFNLAFIPGSIIVFIYPYFARNRDKRAYIKSLLIKLQGYLFILNLIVCLVLFVFAEMIIGSIFGYEYLNAVVPFRILMLGYFISGTFRMTAGNVLACLRKVNINLMVAIISGIVNIILDIILIKYYGYIGAAVATTLIIILSSIISNAYLYTIIYK